jgi:ATP-dependent Clp protease ATP-binding subunit ClpB
VLGEAEKLAQKAGDSFVAVERMLTALAMVKSGAKDALDAGAVNAQALNAAINDLRKGRTADSAGAEDSYEALKKYARDLTEAAREGKIDPIIGRDEEIRRAMQVLSRRTKNNPVLIGEPGVGKTAIARAGPAHRGWRRAGEPAQQEADGARHGRADRGREVSAASSRNG